MQIEEDIRVIQRDYSMLDPRLEKDEFAFNYWILSRIYSLDEDILSPNITEYNDKSIDCFVHYEDTKELFLIQNKYYNDSTAVTRTDVTDFLTTPLSVLLRGQYKNSSELQKVFNRACKDSEYKIWLHFYVSNDYRSDDIDILFNEFTYEKSEVEAYIGADYFTLSEIRRKYYDDRFTKKTKFTAIMPTRYAATSLDVRPTEYDLPWMIDLRYVMINVVDLYQIYENAAEKNYELFEENVREFLGTQGINNGIIRTLDSKKDRENFFYYNNGITIICEACETLKPDSLPKEYKSNNYHYGFKLTNPQIVNGCQTINSIAEVLSHHPNLENMRREFEKSFVLVKVFVFNEETKKEKAGLDKKIVRYTNSQNGISEKAFAAKRNYFLNLQSEFLKRGYLLLVKPSDKNKFNKLYCDKVEFTKLQVKARYFGERLDVPTLQLSDLMIPLEKFLKALLAFRYDGFIAFTKGSLVLKPNSSWFKEFSLNIETWCTIDNMINLYLLHYKSEVDKKKNDKRFPIPYYVMGFIGTSFKGLESNELNTYMDFLFENKNRFLSIYYFYKQLTSVYANDYQSSKSTDYNVMIKQEIDAIMYGKNLNSSLLMYTDSQKVNEFLAFGKNDHQ